jgi:heme/copper-type cytochrome/quinol oxidase subunit 2
VRPLVLTLLVLLAVSISTTALCVLYGGAMIGVPYQDATPAQAAEQQYHSGLFDWLMFGAGLSWLVTVAATVTTTFIWAANRKRNRTEGMG